MLQLVPLKCSMRFPRPTAQTSLAESAVTAFNHPPVEGDGLATMLHFVPSKCSMSGLLSVFPLTPTAHTLLLATAVTPDSSPKFPAGRAGVETTLQLVP